jgi:hypothetical protein
VDVDDIVRTRRRQQALDALAFERDREAAVYGQLEDVLTELEGSRIDAAAYAQMAPEDVALVRHALDPAGDDDDTETDLVGALTPDPPEQLRREMEEERARLEDVIIAARSSQKALERYIEALGADGGTPSPLA